jgi:hypothetical protein
VNYHEACKQATTDQGLDPVVDFLSRADLPVTVDQTGGFCMVAAVYSKDRSHWVWVTDDGEYFGDQPLYHLGYYTEEYEEPVAEWQLPLGNDMTDWIVKALS